MGICSNLSQLTELRIHSLKPSKCPNFERLTHLQLLSCEHNCITQLHDSISSLTQLMLLNVSYQGATVNMNGSAAHQAGGLTELPDISNLVRLKSLLCSSNKIRE